MKIENVIIINDRNYIEGGSDKVALYTAKKLKDKGFNVIFFSAINRKDFEIEGIKYVYTNQNEALREKNKLKGIINGVYNFKAKHKLKKILKELNVDNTIIHVHGWTKALSSSIFDIAFKMNFKVIVTLHDYFTACPNGAYFNFKKNEICHLKPLSWKCIKCNCDSRNYAFKLYRIIRQYVQNKIVRLNVRLKNVITISEFSEKILRETLGENIKIYRVNNPVDIENNNIDINKYEKKDYYLYVGRISPEKGVEVFCKAMTELNYKGIVVGEGKQKESLIQKYPNVKFVGWKKQCEVSEYMKFAKALVFPSIWYETAGLTILEAQNLGTPCIINKNTAASEFLTYGNLYETYEELKRCLINKNYIIKEYKYEDYITNIIKVYKKI